MNPMGVLNPASVVVVSGGARGITAHCVVKLAQKARCKFILLGRSELESEPDWAKDCEDEVELKRRAMKDLQARGEKPVPTKILKTIKGIQARREILGTLQAVRATGGQAEYVSVDITNRQALQDKLVEPMHRLGPVTGIIHGAGNLADKLIEKKSEKDFETVFSPKVDGLSNLLTCIPTRQLDFLVLFSSIVGFYGNVGQSDYAIANEVLNKTAFLLKRQNPECRDGHPGIEESIRRAKCRDDPGGCGC
jgi:NAD(P)-dependent dehydrogenase (short-subunit alcohol dehydrogenase family)